LLADKTIGKITRNYGEAYSSKKLKTIVFAKSKKFSLGKLNDFIKQNGAKGNKALQTRNLIVPKHI